MSLRSKLTLIGGSIAILAGFGGFGYKIGIFDKKPVHAIETAPREPEKKIDDISIPEPIVPKETPKVEPKEEPKVEAPKYESKPVVYQAKATFENPVTYAIAMEQWRVEVAYRKITSEPVQEDAMTRAYRFAKVAGSDNVVQRKELKTSELEAKVEELRKKDNKQYEELNIGSLSISDKTEDSVSITITPADEAQEKRLFALAGYKTPEQAAYVAGMINLHAKEGKITNEKLDYVENKVAEKYGGKK